MDWVLCIYLVSYWWMVCVLGYGENLLGLILVLDWLCSCAFRLVGCGLVLWSYFGLCVFLDIAFFLPWEYGERWPCCFLGDLISITMFHLYAIWWSSCLRLLELGRGLILWCHLKASCNLGHGICQILGSCFWVTMSLELAGPVCESNGFSDVIFFMSLLWLWCSYSQVGWLDLLQCLFILMSNLGAVLLLLVPCQ